MNPSSLHILLYHDIAADEAATARCASPRFTTTVSRLREHLQEIQDAGLRPTRLDEWLQWHRFGRFPAGRHVLITFDGPHIGWFRHAIPMLCERNLPATFFITAGWVGERHRYPESRGLSWADMRTIPEFRNRQGGSLFEIGSHSMWHSPLTRQDGEAEAAYRDRVREEVVNASRLIQAEVGVRPVSFATPKGEGDLRELRAWFDEAGIGAVRWASLPGRAIPSGHDPYDLPIAYCDIAGFTIHDFRNALSLDVVPC